MRGAGPPTPPSGRPPAVRVERATRRKPSSQRWLARQLNDPYVAAARGAGYRSRSAWKLVELDRRFGLLRPGLRVVDLGCAPGGWTQVAVARTAPGGIVVGIDRAPMAPIAGARLIRGEVGEAGAVAAIRAALDGPADLVLCDMAPSATGHARTDHLRILALAEAGYEAAAELLARGGGFVAKMFQGGAEGELLQALKAGFADLKHAKPPASRPESAETYLVARGFRAAP